MRYNRRNTVSAAASTTRRPTDPRPVAIDRSTGRTHFYEVATGRRIRRSEAIALMRAYKQGTEPKADRWAGRSEQRPSAPVRTAVKPFHLKVECSDMQGSWIAFEKSFARKGNAENMLVKLCNEAYNRSHAEKRAVSVNFSLTEK